MQRSLLAVALWLAGTIQGFSMDSLSNHEWKNRVLVVFGDASDDRMVRQIRALNDQADELSDRDMVVLQVSGNNVKAIYGSTGNIDAGKLRAEADVDDDEFRAILVGKDGGIKLRSDKPIGSIEIFDLIDRMPMRKSGQG